ncbi:MAG: chemotaxis protein CheC [Burkholderiaceae bacterium]|nr:chemotaxis protein CheC [Burkholderiaceae bacterium]
MKLTELELDALTEVFNMGVGQAADALSQLAGEPVALSIPLVQLLSKQEIVRQLTNDDDRRVSAVRQGFQGDIVTDAILMFPAEQSLQLVQIMVGGEVPLEDLGEMEQEALAEIGNILLNAVVASVADNLDIALDGSLPEVELGIISDVLLDGRDVTEPLLSLQVRFAIASRHIEGYLAFLLDMQSSGLLEQKVAAFLKKLEGDV